MRLSKRIYALADAINDGDSVADIGTDHGYVPMLLMRQGKSPRVIMSDISEDSLAKARETFAQCGLDSKVPPEDFRVGDGLNTLKNGETDELIIAGLGGHTIKSILEEDEGKSKSFSRLVLQPRKHSGTLRYYLFTRGWDIETEALAGEGKFACEIITAVPSDDPEREAPYPEDDIRWKYPARLLEADPVLARMRIEWKAGSVREQIATMRAAGTDSSEKIMQLRKDAAYLQDLLDQINEKQMNDIDN